MSDLLSFSNENFNNFAFYSGIVLGKTLLMGPLTSVVRISNKSFSNPEDRSFFGGKSEASHALVERIRRCHQNDLENVLPFVLVGLLYVSADPDPEKALRIFRAFTISRLLHTVVYVGQVRQPARAACYFVGMGATAAMGLFLVARFTFMK